MLYQDIKKIMEMIKYGIQLLTIFRGLIGWKNKKINPKCQVKFHDFNLRNKLKKSKDPMRSWTERFGSNKKQLTVGTSQILNYKLIEIINN